MTVLMTVASTVPKTNMQMHKLHCKVYIRDHDNDGLAMVIVPTDETIEDLQTSIAVSHRVSKPRLVCKRSCNIHVISFNAHFLIIVYRPQHLDILHDFVYEPTLSPSVILTV